MNRQYLKEILSHHKKLVPPILIGIYIFMSYVYLGIETLVIEFQEKVDPGYFVFFAVLLFAVCILFLSPLHQQSLFQFVLKSALKTINKALNLIVAFASSLAIACLITAQFKLAAAVAFIGLIFYALFFVSCNISIDLKNKYSIII